MSHGETDHRRGEAGPGQSKRLRLTSINELIQVRQSYDEEAMSDLQHAITVKQDGNDFRFKLLHPLTVGIHTKKSAKRYIREHGDFFEIPQKEQVDVADLTPLPNRDAVAILIAGHRRKRGIEAKAKSLNISLDRVRVRSHLYDGIAFHDAIGDQLRENVHHRPAPHDEARALALFYQFEKNKDPNIGISEFAKAVGFKETRVRSALAFDSLPDEVRAFTTSGVLPYTIVRQLKPLADAYEYSFGRNKDLSAEQIAERVKDSLLVVCNHVAAKRLSGSSEGKFEKYIRVKVDEILQQAAYQQDELFLFEDMRPDRVRKKSDAMLGKEAVRIMQLQHQNGSMSDEVREALASLVKPVIAAQPQGILFEAS